MEAGLRSWCLANGSHPQRKRRPFLCHCSVQKLTVFHHAVVTEPMTTPVENTLNPTVPPLHELPPPGDSFDQFAGVIEILECPGVTIAQCSGWHARHDVATVNKSKGRRFENKVEIQREYFISRARLAKRI